jgi:hypothetical protein
MTSHYDTQLRDFDPHDWWDTHAANVRFLVVQSELPGRFMPPTRLNNTLDQRHASSVTRKADAKAGVSSSHDNNEDTEGVAVKVDATDEVQMQEGSSTATESPTEPIKIFHNHYEGRNNAKQTAESIPDFIARLRPSKTTDTDNGPWIWCANPHSNYRDTDGHIGAYKQAGFSVLDDLSRHRANLVAKNPNKPTSSITRLIKPHREAAEASLRQLARKHHVLTGKWMLFPSAHDVDATWRIVAQATWVGKLGIGAKVATKPSGNTDKDRLVCVYTTDFTDREDVKRVLSQMRELGLVNDAAEATRGIYYKCDAYTHLDLMGGNEHGIRASLYSSRDMFREMKAEKRQTRLG